ASNALQAISRDSTAPDATCSINALISTMLPPFDPFDLIAFSAATATSAAFSASGGRERPALMCPPRSCRAAPAGRHVPLRCDVQEIRQDEVTVLGRDAFRVELDAMHRQRL